MGSEHGHLDKKMPEARPCTLFIKGSFSLSFVSNALSFAADVSVAPNGIKPSADQESKKDQSCNKRDGEAL